MANHAATEQKQQKAVLQNLQQTDPDINNVIVYSKFVVTYFLHQDGANQGWRKSNIEGPVYLVGRRTAPRYQLLVKNQFSTNDLLDSLHPEWEMDCQKNYVFYKVEDPSKCIRGLWFHDDQERQKIEAAVEQTLAEMRSRPQDQHAMEAPHEAAPPPGAPPPPPGVRNPAPPAATATSAAGAADFLAEEFTYASFEAPQPPRGGPPPAGPAPTAPVTVPPVAPGGVQGPGLQITRSSVRAALHALAEDGPFLDIIMAKLRQYNPN